MLSKKECIDIEQEQLAQKIMELQREKETVNGGPDDFGGEDFPGKVVYLEDICEEDYPAMNLNGLFDKSIEAPKFGSPEWEANIKAAFDKQFDEMEEEIFMASRENSVAKSPGIYPVDNLMTADAPYAFAHAQQQTEKEAQQAFATGATRSADDNKFDYEGFLSPEVLNYFASYMHKNRVQRDGKLRASDNWQLGIPPHKYVKSLVRHGIDLWRAWRGTTTYNPDTGKAQTLGELCAAVLFNVQGLLSVFLQAGATDLYHITKKDRETVEQGKSLEDCLKPTTTPTPSNLTAEDAFKKFRDAQRQYEKTLREARPDNYGELLGRERY